MPDVAPIWRAYQACARPATACRGYDAERLNTDRASIHRFPASMAKLVSVRNLVNCRRFTYLSSAVYTENSSRQSGVLEGLRNNFMLSLPGVGGDIDGDRFDVSRAPNPHLAFGGGGTHFCLGANLARVEASAIIPEVLSRMNGLELAGPVERVRSYLINGIHSMPVRFTPARPVAAR